MTIRAIVLGLALGLLVSGVSYFHDTVIRQGLFVGNHLPVAVFGLVIVGLLAINPVLRSVGRRWPLRPGEVGLITALGLAACGWPGYSYFYGLLPSLALPSHWEKVETHWKSTGVMSYLPGGSAKLAEGSVADWPALVGRMAAGETSEAKPIDRILWQSLDGATRVKVIAAAAAGRVDPTLRRQLIHQLNAAMSDPALMPTDLLAAQDLPADVEALLARRAHDELKPTEAQRLNRAALVAVLPQVIRPPPEGEALVLSGDEHGAEIDWVAHGPPNGPTSIDALPWGTWWPLLRTWGGLGLLLAGAAICLSLIVHPQWSARERLAYPLARFVHELADREPGAALPRIACSRLFWFGLGSMILLHLINGLNAWFPSLPAISTQFNFYPLDPLLPNFSSVSQSWYIFNFRLYPTVIAFAFFLSATVSFSVGFSFFLYMIVGAIMLAYGVSIGGGGMGESPGSSIRFGAYVGGGLIILYAGRMYYLDVLRRMVGLRARLETPRYSVWAGYGLLATVALSVVILQSAGLGLVLSTCFILLVLLIYLVLTRIVCETGLFFIQAGWVPVGVLTTLFGIEAIGPTAYIVLALASTLLIGDPRTLLMPYLATGWKLATGQGQGQDRTEPGRASPWVTLMVVAGFVVTGAATFILVHQHGAGRVQRWAYETVPRMPFNQLANHLAEMTPDALDASMAAPSTLQWSATAVDSTMLTWMVVGLVLLVVTGLARLRFAWWPLHPVVFLLWGTMPSARFAVSFLVGWLIKVCVVQTIGAKGHRMVLPLMTGIIAGELLMALGWTTVGGIYYAVTGQVPITYLIYP